MLCDDLDVGGGGKGNEESSFREGIYVHIWQILVAQSIKNLPAVQETQFDPWVGKIPWRRKWQPTPVSLPGKSHGQRSLVGCSPWGCKESGTTDLLTY